MLAKSLGLLETSYKPQPNHTRKLVLISLLVALAPLSSHAALSDLRTSVQSGSGIIMFLCGVLAAVGVVAAGVMMMTGRPQGAKWAFVGAIVSGLGFTIVKTTWANFGLEATDVSTFTN